MKLFRDNSEVLIRTTVYDPTRRIIVGYSEAEEDEFEFQFPLEPSSDWATTPSDFQLHLFHKTSFVANDVYQVRVGKDKRIGWLFPLEALLNGDHDFARNEHFFPYALNAYRILVEDNEAYPSIDFMSSNGKLTDVYGENTHALVLYEKSLLGAGVENFSLDPYLVQFYLHGYTLLTRENMTRFILEKPEENTYFSFSSKAITLEEVSGGLLSDKIYLSWLLRGAIKTGSHPLIKFHLLYSIIELLIAKIFESEFRSALDALSKSSDFYDAKEKLGAMMNEKTRIAKLFSGRCPGINQDRVTQLGQSCKAFLVMANLVKSDDTIGASDSLYKVRSALFHNLRLMPIGYESALNQIVLDLEIVAFDLVWCYE